MKSNLNIDTIHQAINQATQQLAEISSSPRLDAELLVACLLQKSRSWLYAHFTQNITPDEQDQLNNLLKRRLAGEPMAYILGYKEFWALKLKITSDVLIPRPETEHMIEWILNRWPAENELWLADLGTGSGAIALALASERPHWQIDATDQSSKALNLAKENATHYEAHNVRFYQGNWCTPLPHHNYGLIVSNPPYIAEQDPHLAQLSYEPSEALCAGEEGLKDIEEIICQAKNYLTKPGYLILEHGYHQAPAVVKLFKQQGYVDVQSHIDLAKQPRFVTACYQ